MTVRDAMGGQPGQPEQITIPNPNAPDLTPQVEPDVEPPAHAVEAERERPAESAGWLAILQADTPKDQVHQRAAMNRGGQPVLVNNAPLMLDYVTARFVQDRLDAAVGPSNWQTAFEGPMPSGAVRCGIGIKPPEETEWVWKWDVGVPSNIEPDKGAHSDAFKRAGVQWGIARDLYDDRDEKVMNAVPSPMAVQQPQMQPQMQQQPMAVQPGNGQPPPGIQYASETGQPIMPQGAQMHQQMAWLCPLHETAHIVPAGISKRTQKPYAAFYACPVPGCDETGPRA
jgi:hypothetical protein